MPALFLAILAIGVGLRFWHLTLLPAALYPDEAFYGTDTLRSMASGTWRVFYPLNNGHEGLIVWLHAPFIMLFGTTPWVLRLQPAVIGSLTLAGMYFLGWEFARGFTAAGRDEGGARRLALLAMLFLATNEWHLHLSRMGFRAVHVVFFATLALWALLRARRLDSAISYGIAGAMTAMAVYTYPNGRFVPFVPLGIFAIDWMAARSGGRGRIRLAGFVIFAAAAGVVFAPLGLYYIGHLGEFFARYEQVAATSSASPVYELLRSLYRTLQAPFFFGDGQWRHNVSDAPLMNPLIAFPCFLGLFLAAVSIAHRLRWLEAPAAAAAMRPFGAAALLWCCAVMSVPAILTTESIPHALRSDGMLPPLIICAAVVVDIALAWALRAAVGVRGRIAVAGAVFFAAMLLAQSAWYQYFMLWAENPKSQYAYYPDMTDLAVRLDREPDRLPKYVVTGRDGVAADLHWLVQPIEFITDTAAASGQQRRNLHYVTVAELRAKGVRDERALYVLIDEAAPARAWLQQQAPSAEIWVAPHSWQQMQDLLH